jgi:hypothetical protein
MKALILNIGLSVFGLAFFTACNSGGTNQKATEKTEINQEVAGATYTCPMHPEVTSAEPGKCPKCGMNLEKATAGEHDHKPGDQH